MTTAANYFATQKMAVRNPLHALLKAWEALAVFRASGNLRGERVLDLGAGDGYYAKRALKAGAENILCLDVTQRSPHKPGITFSHFDLDKNKLDVSHFRERQVVYALGLLEFLHEPFDLLQQIAELLPRKTRLILLYPPPTLCGYLYRAFHQQHGVKIQLLASVADALKPLRLTHSFRPHPYARVETYAHE